MTKWIETPSYQDEMPIDISFAFGDEAPAGKHGFLKAVGNDFCFEDGKKARFFGVNMNGSALFPEHDYAEKVAKRLRMTGINLVRFHQMDAEWASHNLYRYARGKRVETTRELDPESFEKLDYFLYALKKEGIYIYLDLMTYRKFRKADDVLEFAGIRDCAKPFHCINARLIELQKEFAKAVWTHENPYTGLEYRNEPAIVLTEIVNESDLFTMRCNYEPGTPHALYAKELREAFRDWLSERGLCYDWEHCDMQTYASPLTEFKIDMMQRYFGEMRDYLVSLGVRIPITGTNWSKFAELIPCHKDMDFTDSHCYFKKDWTWDLQTKELAHCHVTEEESVFGMVGRMKIEGKPFFLSEWAVQWPNRYRAEGTLHFAAVSSLQGWGGLAVHTYSYDTKLSPAMPMGKEISSPGIANVPYRAGVFSCWNDPAVYGLFYHSALMVRRSDVREATEKYSIVYDRFDRNDTLASASLSDRFKMGTVLPGNTPEGTVIRSCESLPESADTRVLSVTKELFHDREKKLGIIDSERTKAVYGMLGAQGEISLSGLKVRTENPFGVVALSSLTDDPTDCSPNLLLTAMGEVKNTGMTFDGNAMTNLGAAPVLSEVLEAEITLKTSRTDLQVWSVGPEGFYVGRIPAVFQNGEMKFTIGTGWDAVYYLITVE